jgi:hypothetical protein
MAQHDYNIANSSGLNVRADLNNVLAAIVSKNSGNSAPTETFAYMWWTDTSGAFPVLRVRNAANSGWILIGRLDQEEFGLGYLKAGDEPSPTRAYQYWVDTAGANPILKIRNTANDAWITIGRVDVANYGLLPLTGGTLSGAISFTNTDHVRLPQGTDGQRPGSPGAGMIRFNTTQTAFEGHNGTAWAPIGGGGYVVSSTQNVGSGGDISSSTSDVRQLRPIQGNAAPVISSFTPFGATGGWKDGTEILLVGISDSNSVTLTYSDVAKGLVGNFNTIEVTRFKTVLCTYSSALDRWIVTGGI